MPEQQDQLDPVEALWRELDEADRASVFAHTPVSLGDVRSARVSDSSNEPSLPTWVIHLRRRWVPIAAMLALVVSVWGFLLSRELNHIRKGRSPSATAGVRVDGTSGDRFALRCLNGPGGSISDACRPSDLDTDGQVTLADYGAHQLALLRHRHQ